MGYRIEDKKPREPRRDVQGAASPSTVFIQNGSTLEYAIPCWYLIAEEPLRSHCHSRQLHDHIGWPSPTKPDHICQDWEFAHSCRAHKVKGHHHDHCKRYLDMEKLHPIHLTEEGYSNIEIVFNNKPEGFNATGYIDEKRDWIVRITIDSKVAEATNVRVEVPYAVFASGNVMGQNRRDAISRGVMVILPGPIGV